MSSQIIGFNYDALEVAAREKVREHSQQIRLSLERTAASIVEIGKRLICVREALGEQEYRGWLLAEFQWNRACAATYEAVAATFGNLDCIERFNPSALYMLCRPNTEPRIVKEAIKGAERGEMITRATVARLIGKFQPPERLKLAQHPAQRTGLQAPRANSTGANRESLPVEPGVSTFRSLLDEFVGMSRRLDVAQIPADERSALADQLLDLVLLLRAGRPSTSEPYPGESPTSAKPRARKAARELARA
jgi:hypothetical protein